jgi:hypothetical protein
MPDPVISDSPFGQIPSWPPSPARLDRDLDCQNNHVINVNWSGHQINLSTDVTGKLSYANIQDVPSQRLLGSTNGGVITPIIIGSNLTLTGDTLSAATSGGAGSGDFSTNTSTSVVNEIVLFSNTGGKQGKRSTGTGACRLASGVLAVGPLPLATDVSGTLPATNFPALSGDVFNLSGTLTTHINTGAVTNAMLAGGITASNLVGNDIATIGTVTSGTWAATPVSIAYGGLGSSTVAGARAALLLDSRTDVGDADYTITASDTVVNLTAALTAVRTFSLPVASTVNPGKEIVIVDSVGGVSTTNYIQIAPNGAASNTVNGGTNPFLLLRKYDVVRLTATATAGWVVSTTQPVIRKAFLASQTYTTPVGIKALYVECVGGGGAGGGAPVASSNLSLGSGGGGAGYSATYIDAPIASYLITIGAGGAGVSGANGNNGGNTSFGSVCISAGGFGGQILAAGTSQAFILGSVGGAGSTGDVLAQGSSGEYGHRLSASLGISGAGGTSAFGYGGSNIPRIATLNGNNGYPYGGGGSGAFTTGAAQTGGTGGDGICLVTEFY